MRRAARALALGMVSMALGVLGACGGDDTAATLDRATFIDVWVDLRAAAVASPGREIRPATRDLILEQHGVTQDELLEFAEVHGDDIDFMKAVWDEVVDRLEAQGVSGADSSAVLGPGG